MDFVIHWWMLVVIAIALWILIGICIVGTLRYGKHQDVKVMKHLMDTDDDDLARNVLETEEDIEQKDALQAEYERQQRNREIADE